MKQLLILLLLWLPAQAGLFPSAAIASPVETAVLADATTPQDHGQEMVIREAQTGDEYEEEHGKSGGGVHHGTSPSPWSVIPFVMLLAMIATGPLFYAHFWHRNYQIIAVLLGVVVVVYYLAILHDTHHPLHAFGEYFSFIALIAALYIASGGILIEVEKEGTPWVNIGLLVFGAALANIIGTTGASMLLIRPFMRLNKNRIQPYHVVFFIFMVSNVGGCLTPIGDPPLFLGFLKGVPFFWTVEHLWIKWFFGIVLLAVIFFFIDKRNHKAADSQEREFSGKIRVRGLGSSVWLIITIIAVFIDPNVIDGVPALVIDGVSVSFVRELIMIFAAVMAFKTANKDCLKGNEFNFEPIKEVGFLFIGIFATMMPALQLISEFANSDAGSKLVNVDSLYWVTGILSGVLDNAPTYLNFLAAGMGKFGLDIGDKTQVLEYTVAHIPDLIAISVGAVFFGAFTYIGNAPNFMVKSIAEQGGVKMPSFMGYVIRFSIPILLPVLFLTWLVFFVLL